MLFGSEKNVDILEDFLKATLRLPEEEYSHIQITDPYSTIDKIDDKTIILDVKVYTKSKHVVNVEMQVLSQNSDNTCYPTNYIIREVFKKPVKCAA